MNKIKLPIENTSLRNFVFYQLLKFSSSIYDVNYQKRILKIVIIKP